MINTTGSTYKPVASATSHSIEKKTEMLKTSNKSTGNFETSIPGRKSASLTVEGMVSFDINICNYKTLSDLFDNQTLVYIISPLIKSENVPLFDTSGYTMTIASTGLTNTQDAIEEGTPAFYAAAYISALSLSSPDAATCTFNASFDIAGEFQTLIIQ